MKTSRRRATTTRKPARSRKTTRRRPHGALEKIKDILTTPVSELAA